MIQRLGEHAAVIGGSIAGLLAARVLCRHFERVTIFEQDPLDGNRPGVPQSSQTHVLLPAGARVLERLFPGRLAEMVRDGAHQFDYGESRFHLIGNWMPRVETGLMTLAQTRPFLESHIRRWVNEIPNVRLASGSRVAKLLFNDARTRVRGVSLAGRAVGADLIIDAAGRNSRLPLWLGGVVPETTLKINLGYTTGKFRVPASMSPDHPILYVVGRPPGLRRFGSICGVERDGANIIVCGALGGYHGDHPPGDPDGFLAFAKSLHEPLVHDILSQSELIEPLARYAIPAAVRRHYDRLERMPDGVLPIGDAACCFDPAFAQGMSVAALEAEALDDCLNRATGLGSRLTRDYRPLPDCVQWAGLRRRRAERLRFNSRHTGVFR